MCFRSESRRYESNVEQGTPQGGNISPLLANVYLHYALDLWTHNWRKKWARGGMIFVRYADDFIVGFQHREDAEKYLTALRQRLERFKLELHPQKTRLIEFGRYAADRRSRRGEGKPETFDFLGFTHICGTTRTGKYVVLRRTKRKSRERKLQAIKDDLRRRLHWPWWEVGDWLASVLRGHFQYYGVPLNYAALAAMRDRVIALWRGALLRRSQRTRLTWERYRRMIRATLPPAKIYHPYPEDRFKRHHPR